MDIWHYHPATGEYMGPGKADPDPMTPGEWLIPAHCALTGPPAAVPAKCTCVFANGAWSTVPDHRGETWWREDRTPVVITGLGNPAVEGLVSEQPEAPPEPEAPAFEPAPKQPQRTVTVFGSTFAYPDLGKLAIALNLANAAMATGVRAGDLRWHGGQTDYSWPDINGQPVPMDVQKIIGFAQAVHNS